MNRKHSNNWYVLQVITKKENKVEEVLNKLSLKNLKPFLPKKKLKIRKNGQIKDIISPLYPGYIFIIGKWDINEAKDILKCPNTVKFIGGINTPGFLRDDEKEIILKITKDGLTDYSKVISIGRKIKVISGPLKELEGVIESVDRRKHRAIVKMPLLNSTIKVTLGFEFIESNTNTEE